MALHQAIVESQEPLDAALVRFVMVITDEITKARREFIVSSVQELTNVCRSVQMSTETSKDLLALTPGTVLDLTIPPPDPPPTPTPDDIATAEFAHLVNDWRTAQVLESATLENAQFTADAFALVQTEYAKATGDLLTRYRQVVRGF